jgi:ATP-dependent Clp protease adapter protein ClpS
MSHSQPEGPSAPGPEHSPFEVQRIRASHEERQHALPRYKVVLLHNPSSDLMHVVRTVMELTRFCRAEATHKMWQAHHNGRAILLITWLERAELYVEQFAQRGLRVATEPE